MRRSKASSFLGVLALAAAEVGSAAAQDAASPRRSAEGASPPPSAAPMPSGRAGPVYDLERCLELAGQNYPRVAEARARLKRVRAQLSEARRAPFGEFKLTGAVGVIPTLRGTNVYSPDSDLTLDDDLSPMYRLGVQGVVPLWTFGKISSLQDAAKAQVALNRAEVRKARNEVMLLVREAYYGLQFARDALALVRDATGEIKGYVDKLVERVDSGDAEEADLYKMRLELHELNSREAEAIERMAIARASLQFLIGAAEKVDIVPGPLTQVAAPLGELEGHVANAGVSRPEIEMAQAGVQARQAQLAEKRAGYLPDVGLALSAETARGGSVTDQQNPFARDPINYDRYGGVLVLNWKLDFWPQAARVDQARAQLAEVQATQRYAQGGVGLEVEKAFHQAAGAQRRMQSYAAAVKLARRWLITTQQGIEIGAYEHKDLAEPAREYATKRFAHMSAIYDYNVAVARLALATGQGTSGAP